MEGIVPVNLVLMANTIQNMELSNPIEKVYDLKGSVANRFVKIGENQTMKDLNLLSCKRIRSNRNQHGLLQFNTRDIKTLQSVIKKDA